jgi:hypothetical protein
MGRSPAGLALVVLVVTSAACSTLTGTLAGGRIVPLSGGEPVPLNPMDGQVVATGTVLDPEGRGVPDAVVFVVLDPPAEITAELEVGDAIPQTDLLAVTTGPDGSFTIRLGRDPRIAETAEAEGGFVNLTLTTLERWPSDSPGRMGFWGFPLTVTDAGFEDLPAPITINLMGG